MRYESARLADFSAVKAKKHRGQMDWSFFSLVMLLLSMGLLMILSASFARAYYDPGNVTGGKALYFFVRQLVFAAAGTFSMVLASLIPMETYKKYAMHFLLLSIFLLMIVPFAGTKVNGSRRWLGLPGIRIQPSELSKLALILAFSKMISERAGRMQSFKEGILPFGLIIALIVGLLILEPHFSASVIIIVLGGIMLFLGGVKLRWFIGAISVMAAGLAVLLIFFPYASGRISTWLDPFASSSDEGYQIVQSLYSIGSGGLSGLGFGRSVQKYLYLPEEHNDFIFSVYCEEMGFIGASLILCLFALLIIKGYKTAMACRDRFSFFVCGGITSLLFIQVFLNVAVVTNLMPCTGISLPFFSYGGTALMMELFEMGIILSASRDII